MVVAAAAVVMMQMSLCLPMLFVLPRLSTHHLPVCALCLLSPPRMSLSSSHRRLALNLPIRRSRDSSVHQPPDVRRPY